MVPNINPNPRNRQSTKRGRKPFFDAAIFKERFNTIERVFGWEDKFRHLLLRFERLSELHYAFKSLAYAMINLRHFANIGYHGTRVVMAGRHDLGHPQNEEMMHFRS
jgi:hypothetical protein